MRGLDATMLKRGGLPSIRRAREELLVALEEEELVPRDVEWAVPVLCSLTSEARWRRVDAIILDRSRPFPNRAAAAAAVMAARRPPGLVRSLADAQVFFDLACAGLVLQRSLDDLAPIVWDALRGLPPDRADLLLDPLERWRVPMRVDAWWAYDTTLRSSPSPRLLRAILARLEFGEGVEEWLFDEARWLGPLRPEVLSWLRGPHVRHPAFDGVEVWRVPGEPPKLVTILPIVGSPTAHGLTATWEVEDDFTGSEGTLCVDPIDAEERAKLLEALERDGERLDPVEVGRSLMAAAPPGERLAARWTGLSLLAPPETHLAPRGETVLPPELLVVHDAVASPVLVEACLRMSDGLRGTEYTLLEAGQGGQRGRRASLGRRLVRTIAAPDSPWLIAARPWQEDLQTLAARALAELEDADVEVAIFLVAALVGLGASLAGTEVLDDPPLWSSVPASTRAQLAGRVLLMTWTSPEIDDHPDARVALEPWFRAVNGQPASAVAEVLGPPEAIAAILAAAGPVTRAEVAKLTGFRR